MSWAASWICCGWAKPTPYSRKLPSRIAAKAATAVWAALRVAEPAAVVIEWVVIEYILSSPATPGGVGKGWYVRRQVSWLAGRRIAVRLPDPLKASGMMDGTLAAYSCGGSRGIGASRKHRTAFPIIPAARQDGQGTVGRSPSQCRARLASPQ